MGNITYQDKDKTVLDGVRNKWRDIDANEVKQAVNSKADADQVASALASKQNNLGYTPENSASRGAANGYAPLGADSTVPDGNIKNSAEGVKGALQISNQAESESANDATLNNRNHTKALTARGWRWALEAFFNWVTYDRTNRTIIETGINNLNSVLRRWRNSDLTAILTLYNDLRAEFGGSISEIEIPSTITAGNASLNFNDLTGEQYAFKDKSSNKYITFERLADGTRIVRNRRAMVLDRGVGMEVYNDQVSIVTTGTAAGQNVVLSIPIPAGFCLSFKAYHMIAYATDESVVSADDLQVTAKNVSGTVTSASNAITHQRLPNTLNGSFNTSINGTTFQLRFQNESGTGKTYTIELDYTYTLIPKP
jgi:hypothetical protein